MISASAGAKQLQVEIVDNGCGIAPVHKSELFRFGFSTKMEGSGFGLHMVGNFVANCSGTIQVESEGAGMGTQIKIALPLQ